MGRYATADSGSMLELGLLGNMSRRICPSINDESHIPMKFTRPTTESSTIIVFSLIKELTQGFRRNFRKAGAHANGEA